jgi:hypothetical protein
MRAIFGVLGLLVVLAMVGLLVKKQLVSAQQVVPGLQVPDAVNKASDKADSTVRQQSQQIQQQYKQALESAMQQARPMPDDK